MLTVVQDADEANGNEAGQRSLLDEIERDGARQMLAAAWQAEVTAPRVNAVSILRPVSGRGLPKFYVSRQAPGG
jgi:hypothetical protein